LEVYVYALNSALQGDYDLFFRPLESEL